MHNVYSGYEQTESWHYNAHVSHYTQFRNRIIRKVSFWFKLQLYLERVWNSTVVTQGYSTEDA